MRTHNLCFVAKMRTNVHSCTSQFYYIKAGCKGVFITRTCYPDDGSGNIQGDLPKGFDKFVTMHSF